MDRATYNAQLKELRPLRDKAAAAAKEVVAAQKALTQKQSAFDILNAERETRIKALAAYEGASGEAVAKAGGLKLADVVRIAPSLDPTPPEVRAALSATSSAEAGPAAPPVEHSAIAPASAEATVAAPRTVLVGPPATAPAPAAVEESEQAVPIEPSGDTELRQRVLPSIPDGPGAQAYTRIAEVKRRRPTWEQNAYHTVWLDARTGDLATATRQLQVDLGGRTPGEILDAVIATLPNTRRIYITGGDPWHQNSERHPTLIGAVADWLNTPSPRWEPRLGRGAGQDPLASHLVHERKPVGRYRPADAERNAGAVEILSAAQWFEPGGADAALVRDAFVLMRDALRRQWDDAVMMSFPSSMGLDLWKRTIPVSGAFAGGYPVMSAELRELVHETAGQGRTELILPPRVPAELPGLAEYDRTLAYGRHTWRSGVGAPNRLTGRMFQTLDRKEQTRALMAPSHWQIRATVPEDWRHVGLLPCPVPGDRAWEYPATPGTTFTTWASGAEINVALNNPQQTPWRIEILDGLVWKEAKPLDDWSNKLKTAWSGLVNLSRVHGNERTRRAAHLASRGIRSILLYGIGKFAQRPGMNTGTTPSGQPVPDGAELIDDDGTVQTWRRLTTTDRDAFAHPEWAAGVWGGARAALLDMTIKDGRNILARVGALHLPAGSVVALRTDAVYTTHPVEWPYRGQPGEYLAKGYLRGPVAAPRSEDDLLALRELGRARFDAEAFHAAAQAVAGGAR
ncbi:hypothetical protein ACFXPX_04435 [Kitasatospora sp. NPDC059146]|uniref:hypothetical protein n=1 Tax=unclassified Kitasatospora TaxID=2633591 RepID=UPI0036A759A0